MNCSSVVEAILKNALVCPEQPALTCREQVLTYQELAAKIRIFASNLKDHKVKKNQKIILESSDEISYLVAFFACQLMGAVAVPIEENISIYKLQSIMKSLRPSLVFLKNNGEKYEDYLCRESDVIYPFRMPGRDDTSLIVSSFSMDGSIVYVEHSNLSVAATSDNLIQGTGLTENTIMLIDIPLNAIRCYRRIFAVLMCGGSVVISERTFTAESLIAFAQKYQANRLSITSTQLPNLISEFEHSEYPFPSILRQVESVSAPLPYHASMDFHRLVSDIVLYNVYGTTETGCVLIHNTKNNLSTNCLGKPSAHSEVFLIDENGNTITQPGKYGHIAVAGDVVMNGYYKKKTLTNKVIQDNKVISNDIAYFDEEGFFYFVSRSGEVIVHDGHKISPKEIELAASGFDAVVECACAAKEDPVHGHVPILYTVFTDNTEPPMEEFMEYIRNRLETYSVPQEIILLDSIPRMSSGQPLRKSLGLKRKASK